MKARRESRRVRGLIGKLVAAGLQAEYKLVPATLERNECRVAAEALRFALHVISAHMPVIADPDMRDEIREAIKALGQGGGR